MTEARCRVTFWNAGSYGRLTDRQRNELMASRQIYDDHFTDWTDESSAKALGEKLIRDGVWVTEQKPTRHDPPGNLGVDVATFLVPPARIREVTLETRDIETPAFAPFSPGRAEY